MKRKIIRFIFRLISRFVPEINHGYNGVGGYIVSAIEIPDPDYCYIIRDYKGFYKGTLYNSQCPEAKTLYKGIKKYPTKRHAEWDWGGKMERAYTIRVQRNKLP